MIKQSFNWLDQHWRSAISAPIGSPEAAVPNTWAKVGTSVFWPIAIVLFFHRIFIFAVNGSVTDDFSTVYYALRRFIEGVNVYNEEYNFVDPHYLYSPGATLALSPLGYLTHFAIARLAFICVNAAAVVVALGVLTKLFGHSLRGYVWPMSIAAAFLTEAVTNTLIFSNINGILLLILSLFYATMYHRKYWWAGVLLGAAILVKPIFAPLLFIVFFAGAWPAFVGAIAVPVVLNAIAWPLVPGASDYVTRTMPYLAEVRDYANSSLPGQAVYFGMPPALQSLFFYAFALIIVMGLVCLLRDRTTDPLLWMTTTGSLLFAGVFLLSGLGQMYYSMLLFPLFFTIVSPRSPMRVWVAWLAAFCFLSFDSWTSHQWVELGTYLQFWRPGFGWAALVIAISFTALRWTLIDASSRNTPAPAHAARV